MNHALIRAVRERAENQCEYCRLPESSAPIPFQVDHIIAAKHCGLTEPGNLALACPHCNLHKGPNIGGRDPDTRQFSRLFHPRTDQWPEGILALRAELLEEGLLLLP